jgi:3D (Asp-Asp-Asp) domain-containing protein
LPNSLRPFNAGGAVNPPSILVIHHTADDDEIQRDKTERTHSGEGYPESVYGSHIAYHFLIGKDGTVIQNRSLAESTQHTRNSEVNQKSIAIAFAGDFTKEEPDERQVMAGRELIVRLDKEYSFTQIIGHKDASPTACPGQNLTRALSDLWRGDSYGSIWKITRYYTPVKGQTRYFRKVDDKDFIHRMDEFDFIWHLNGQWYYSFSGHPVPVGNTLEEADAWFKDRPGHREALRKEMEYMLDFRVNCQGNCLSPADGRGLYTEADAFKVLACPPEFAFGTQFEIEGIGTLTCRDRGGAIKDRRLDVWAGIGDKALSDMNKYPGNYLRVRILP